MADETTPKTSVLGPLPPLPPKKTPSVLGSLPPLPPKKTPSVLGSLPPLPPKKPTVVATPPTLPAHLQRPRSVPTPQDIADQRNVGLVPPQQTGLQRLRGLVGGDAPRTAPDSTPVYTTPEHLRPMAGGVPVGEALSDAVTRPFEGVVDTPLYIAQRGLGGVQNIGEGVVAGGLSAGRGMGLSSLPSPQLIADMRAERQLDVPDSPVAQYGGDAAELVGNLGPLMFGGLAGMGAGAASMGGEAAMQGKSGGGQMFNATLGMLPGMRYRVPGLGQAAGQVVGGSAVNAAIPLLTATETAIFEDNPELAQQELDQVLPEGATGLTLETAVQLASRGRAPHLPPLVQHGAPTQTYSPAAAPTPSPTNLVVPEGIPSYAADAPAPVPPREAPYAVTPEVIQAVRDNPQLTTSVRDIAENMAANTPDTGPSPLRAMEAEAAKKQQMNLAGDEAVQAAADMQRGTQSLQQADDAALRQQELAEIVDNALGEKPRGLTEAVGRPPDVSVRDTEKARFEGGQRTAEQLKEQFQADLKDIIRQRNEGLIGKPQAGALRTEAKARYDAALAPQITKAADTAEAVARAGELPAPAPGTHKVYHGSSRGDITRLDAYGGEYGLFGSGAYLTTDPKIGASYKTKGDGLEPSLYQTEVTVKNPMDMDAPLSEESRAAWVAHTSTEHGLDARDFASAQTNEDAFRLVEEALRSGQRYSKTEASEIVQDIIRAMGHDSLTHIGGERSKKSDGTRHRVYVAFDSEQIAPVKKLRDEEESALTGAPSVKRPPQTEESSEGVKGGVEIDATYRDQLAHIASLEKKLIYGTPVLSPEKAAKRRREILQERNQALKEARAAQPPAPTAPPRVVEPPPPVTPDYAPAAQKLPAPVAAPAPNQKVLDLPGYKHLSPEARTYLATLKPGERAMLKGAVRDIKKTPTDNDKAYLSRSLNRLQGVVGRSPLDTSKGEKLPPPPPRTPPPPDNRTPPTPPTPEPKPFKRHGALSRFTGLVHERMWKTLAKKPGGEKVARMGQGVLDRAMELRAKVSTTAYKALKALPKDARKSFAQERTEGQFIYARIHDVLEQRSAPRPEEQKFFDLLKKLYYDTGLQKQLANMKIRTKAGLIPFTADKDRISAPRKYTADFLEMAQQPNSPDTQDFIKNLAEANPDIDIARIRKEVADFADDTLTMRGMAEDSRAIKNMPTAFRTKDGRVIQIQSADPSEMVKALSDRTTARTAFVETFGQDEVPKAFLELMGDNASPETRDAAHELFRTLNHLELKDPGKDKFSGVVAPSGKAAKIRQMLGSAWSARKLGALSTAGIANAPELMGKPAVIAGRRNVAKALKTFLSTRGEKRNALMEQLENEGAITRTLLDNYWNKNDKTETLTRYMNNLGHLPVHVLNEAHEAITAMAMKLRVEQIREGKGGAMDRLMLMDLDFTPQEIKDTLRGGFTDREAQKIVRRAVEWALSSTSQPAEVSRLQNSNAWKFATVASKFSSANFNRNFHVVVNALRSLSPESGVSWDNQVKHVLQAVAPATLHVGNAVVNQTAAAGTAMIIRALLSGGASVLADRATGSSLGAEDYIQDALTNSFLQGTLQSFASVFVDDPYDRSIIEHVADTTILSGTAQDVFNFATGKGKYKELSAGERTKEFLRGNVSASPIIANTAHVLGMKQMKPETTASIKAAMEWRRRYMPAGGGKGETTEFSAARRQAERDIEAGRDPSANLTKALGAKDGKTLATSLRGRRILDDFEPKKTDSPEKAEEKERQLEAMEKYLGSRTMSHIREYDSMLDDWAEDVRPLKQGDQAE